MNIKGREGHRHGEVHAREARLNRFFYENGFVVLALVGGFLLTSLVVVLQSHAVFEEAESHSAGHNLLPQPKFLD